MIALHYKRGDSHVKTFRLSSEWQDGAGW